MLLWLVTLVTTFLSLCRNFSRKDMRCALRRAVLVFWMLKSTVLPFGKVFRVDFSRSYGPSRCLMAGLSSNLWKWHRRLGHLSFDLLEKVSSLDLIQGLPKLKSERDLVCHPCRHGKMVAASHTCVNHVMTARPGELLHMDTVGPSRVRFVGGKWYVLVIVDDFSCWSSVHFMESKNEVFEFVHDLVLRLRNESGHAMRALRSDNGSEFKNDCLKTFCHSQGLEHQFLSPYNGVVERKNRTLVEMARTMLDEHRTPRKFWAKAINTACYVSNRIFLRAVLNKTSYELRFGWQPKVSHLRVFLGGFVLKRGNLDKFEPRPHDVGHALGKSKVNATHEELGNFERNQVWVLIVPVLPNPIGTKWVFKNKQGEDGVVVRNKARLVAQASKGFKLFQMDVKSAFLNGFIEEEVYVRQPPCFEHPKFPNRVFKLQKALYGLKQVPRAWYERLKKFLVDQGFQMGSVDKTLFLLKRGKDLLIVQIYVNDIIFGGSSHALCSKFSEQMSKEFEMSMMGELQFFLGLQIRQTPQGTFVHQSKYTRDLLQKFEMADASPQMTPMSMSTALDADEDGKEVDQKVYRGMIGSLL
ncbi:hypothetical protein U9M48_019514 [Paspalum notatum var. saurae]|uniref:Integrase catalytic domain-containing protein n=1 Tax=Paspalum notatum var. saurae TaxID=547442 RepID=A0AAQ3WRB1_PASNO